MTRHLSAALTAAVLAVGCTLPSGKPPDYIKAVTAYKEGSDGMVIYLILADADGRMTTADGFASLTIVEAGQNWNSYRSEMVPFENVVFSSSGYIGAKDFQTTSIGSGAFERDVILYSFGRVRYSQFYSRPTGSTGKVKVQFSVTGGKVLNGEDTIFF